MNRKLASKEKYARLGLKPALSFVKMNGYSTLIKQHTAVRHCGLDLHQHGEGYACQIDPQPELASDKFHRIQ